MVYLSFSQTAGIRYPRMPMYVYNLDGPFKPVFVQTSDFVKPVLYKPFDDRLVYSFKIVETSLFQTQR